MLTAATLPPHPQMGYTISSVLLVSNLAECVSRYLILMMTFYSYLLTHSHTSFLVVVSLVNSIYLYLWYVSGYINKSRSFLPVFLIFFKNSGARNKLCCNFALRWFLYANKLSKSMIFIDQLFCSKYSSKTELNRKYFLKKTIVDRISCAIFVAQYCCLHTINNKAPILFKKSCFLILQLILFHGKQLCLILEV